MNIGTVIEYLNKQKGYALSAEYYDHIQIWSDWWKGYHKPFHEFVQVNGDYHKTRNLYTIGASAEQSDLPSLDVG